MTFIPEWKNAWQRQFGVMPPQDVDDFCPVWHFLPGPYGDDPDRAACPRAFSHPAMRVVYEGQMRGNES